MPEPMALCIEDLAVAPGAARYLRCVALGGRQPGLRLDAAGAVQWQHERAVACELWVSADERLVLYRPAGAAEVVVRRSERRLEVPAGKPVFVLDKDLIEIGARRLRLHVHGLAPAVSAPAPLEAPPASRLSQIGKVATAAALVGAALANTGCIEVRETPPAVGPMEATPVPSETVTSTFTPTALEVPSVLTPTPTIEIREFPPTLAPLEP